MDYIKQIAKKHIPENDENYEAHAKIFNGSSHNTESNLEESTNQHKGFSQVFREGQLTFGFIAPLDGYPNGPFPNVKNFEKIIRKADKGNIDIIWLRDVPIFDPTYGDAGQIYDPISYAGWIAAITKRIAIGTAGLVLPLRNPLLTTKEVVTIDHLSNGRFILGLASGDRLSEYPAFGISFEDRLERFRESRSIIRAFSEESWPILSSKFFGSLNGTIALVPKPTTLKIPTVAIGRAGQSLEWIADNMDAWIWHGQKARNVEEIMRHWRLATKGIFKPYGYAHYFDLSDNPNEPLSFGSNFLKGGRNQLLNFWQKQLEDGLSHAVLNIKPTLRPAIDIIEEFSMFIIPQFR